MKSLLLFSLSLIFMTIPHQATCQNSFSDNGMTIDWSFDENQVIFEITSPSDGWQAIGFNEFTGLSGTYLIMGRIKEGLPEVVEHYTESPGKYQSISKFGFLQRAKILDFKEGKKSTYIKFSLPIHANNKYQKDLLKGSKYHMLYAYSMDDDFQHHSIFRRSTKMIF